MGVRVESTQWHTYQGSEYAVGDQYDTDEQTAASLEAQGKAKRVAAATTAITPATIKVASAPADAPATRTTAVEPMTTDAAPIVTPKARNRTTAAPRVTRRPATLRGPRPKARATGKGRK